MDSSLKLPYGTKVCVPWLNEHYNKDILLEVRDSSIDLTGAGYSRVDICVRTEEDTYDLAVNKKTTLVLRESIKSSN